MMIRLPAMEILDELRKFVVWKLFIAAINILIGEQDRLTNTPFIFYEKKKLFYDMLFLWEIVLVY